MTWKKKGNRIRASDKSLVYHFCIGWLLLLFVAVFLLLNLRQLLVIDWKDFNLLHAGITWTAYNSITVLIATGVCALVAFLYYRYGYDHIKRLLHRQKLARMVLENKWYEAENTKDSGFFSDLQSRSREKIVWFPKIYYQMDNGLLHILCEITMGKYQEQLLSLEDKLESGLYCELTDKTLHDGYIEYTLLYDMIANRISIDEVIAENGGLRLMKKIWGIRFTSPCPYLVVQVVKDLFSADSSLKPLLKPMRIYTFLTRRTLTCRLGNNGKCLPHERRYD